MNLSDLNSILSEELKIDDFRAIDTINGVQVSRSDDEIKKMAYAVDASIEVIRAAVRAEVDVLFVHHGIFWGPTRAIDGAMYEKIKMLINADVALYACHLPLDAHDMLGNNIRLAQRLGLESLEKFGEYKGTHIGYQGIYSQPMHISDVYARLYKDDVYGMTPLPILSVSSLVGEQEKNTMHEHKMIHAHYTKEKQIAKVAIISGGGTGEISEAQIAGADLYITGDASHTAYLEAQELGINVFFAGHYFTEVWGVLAVGEYLQDNFNIEGFFIDAPTEL